MAIRFNCPYCRQSVEVDSKDPGERTTCSHCGKNLVIPSTAVSSEPGTIRCPKCGVRNAEENVRCTSCGYALRGDGTAATDSSLGGLIPYKNTKALLAYYLGVFSLIPCIGIPLGISALILGILGLRHAKRHPEAKGQAHAWTGIILGGVCAVGYLILLAVVVAGGLLD